MTRAPKIIWKFMTLLSVHLVPVFLIICSSSVREVTGMKAPTELYRLSLQAAVDDTQEALRSEPATADLQSLDEALLTCGGQGGPH